MKINKWVCLLVLFLSISCSALNNIEQKMSSIVPTPASQNSEVSQTPSMFNPKPTLSVGDVENQAVRIADLKPGQRARQYIETISGQIGNRVINSGGEASAAQYIQDTFKTIGYTPQMQYFTLPDEANKPAYHANIIADKKGQSERLIIVGAHYDSVNLGKGADDNASGVGILLEAAERVKDMVTPYSIRFIAFDAEEEGEKGSEFYVSKMDKTDNDNLIVMVNLDSLIAGDNTYVYGNQGKRGEVRDWVLNRAKLKGLDLVTQTGLNPQYPAGTTGDFGDNAPFRKAGFQYVYFEATNWTLGDKDGYTQVDKNLGEDGKIWHTNMDTLDYIEKTFPGRIDAHLNLFTTLLMDILTDYKS